MNGSRNCARCVLREGVEVNARVSVIIPAYNCAPFITRTVDSALAQARPGIEVEVIVIDDGSRDDTARVVQAMGNRVRFVSKANGGVSSARNLGIEMAQGEFLYFLDADDVLSPDWFAHALAAFERQPELGLVFGNFQRWEAGPEADADAMWASLAAQQAAAGDASDPAYSGWIYHQMLLDSWVLCSAAMVRKRWVEECRGFEPGVPMGEDWEFWIRISRACPVLKMRRLAVLYRQHGNQATRKVRDINYAVQMIENTLQRYGLTGPGGVAARQQDVDAVLAQHSLWHGLAHFENGSYLIGCKAMLAAVRWQPGRIVHWRLLLIALSGLARPYVRYVANRPR